MRRFDRRSALKHIFHTENNDDGTITTDYEHEAEAAAQANHDTAPQTGADRASAEAAPYVTRD